MNPERKNQDIPKNIKEIFTNNSKSSFLDKFLCHDGKCYMCKVQDKVIAGRCEECDTKLARQHYQEGIEKNKKSSIENKLALIPFEFQQTDINNAKYPKKQHFRFIREYKQSLYISGITGRCKTHFLYQLYTARVEANLSVKLFKPRELFSKYSQAYRSGSDLMHIIQQIKNRDILFIDDFGKETMTNAYANFLFELFDFRLSNHMPIIITSNIGIMDLIDKFEDVQTGEPFARRLLEFMEHIEL